jgi:hypothetical protein
MEKKLKQEYSESRRKLTLLEATKSKKKNLNLEFEKEAFEIGELFEVMNKTRWNMFDKEFYVLSAKWFAKWKNYVSYDSVQNQRLFKKEHHQKRSQCKVKKKHAPGSADCLPAKSNSQPHPGLIFNETLLMDSKDYFHDFSNPLSYNNLILKDNLQEGKDYYIVTKSIWKYLHNKYSGKEIVRYSVQYNPNGKVMIDISLQRVRFIYFIIFVG